MRARLIVIACMVALAAALLLPSAASATTTTTLTKLERQVVDLVNQKRAKNGLVKLRVNTKLQYAARAHSREMAAKQYFSHNSASGEAFQHRLIRYGYKRSGCSYWAAGENIAWGSGLYATAVATVNAWMKSPGHRAVILTRKFRDIGLGAVVCQDGYGSCSSPVTFFTMDVGRRIY
jgi:uncharacterized protein YkwD